MEKFKRELILLIVVLFTVSVLSKETRQQVVVMDTGIVLDKQSIPYMCTEGHIDLTGTGLVDNLGHGTNVAGLIAKGMDLKKHCLVIIKYYNTEENPTSGQNVGEVLDRAWDHLLTLNASYVNMSFTGEFYVHKEFKTIRTLLDRGVYVSVAAGNEGKDLTNNCLYYPGCYGFKSKTFFVVSSLDGTFGNRNGPVNVYEWGVNQKGLFGPTATGTSQATANWTANLLRRR
jgi:hypothetical protein